MRIFILLFVSSLLVSIKADEESVVQKEDVASIVQEEAQVLNNLQVQSDRRWTEFGEEVTRFIGNSEAADGDAGDKLKSKFVSMSQQDRQVKDQLNLKVKRELVETAKKGMQQIFGVSVSMGPEGTVTCPELEASSYCDGDGDCWEAPESWCACEAAQALCAANFPNGADDYFGGYSDDYYGGYSNHYGGYSDDYYGGYSDHYGGYSDDDYGGYSDHYGGYSDDYYGGYSDHYGGYSDDCYGGRCGGYSDDYYGGYSDHYSGYSDYDHYDYYGDDEWWEEPTAAWWEDLIAGGEDFGQYAIAIIRDLGHHACPEGYGTGDYGLDGICEEYFGYENHYHHHYYHHHHYYE